MKIFKDIFSGDEIFSDTYKFVLVDEVMYEVYGKYVTTINDRVVINGVFPSEEEIGTDLAIAAGVDIVLKHRLEKIAYDKNSYKEYFTDYTKRVVKKLEEKSPDQVELFKANVKKFLNGLWGRFEYIQCFTGESRDPTGMVSLMEYKSVDGERVPVLYVFKHGLDEEII